MTNPQNGRLIYVTHEDNFARQLTTDLAQTAFFGLAQTLGWIKNLAENTQVAFELNQIAQYEVDSIVYSLGWFENFLKANKAWGKSLQKTKRELGYEDLLETS